MEQLNPPLPTERQSESSTKRLLKLCLVGDNETGKTARIEKFVRSLDAENVYYAQELISQVGDRDAYIRFLVRNYLVDIPSYLFIKQGDEEVLRVLKKRLVGRSLGAENLLAVMDRFIEEEKDIKRDLLEATLVLSLFDGIVPPEKPIVDLRAEFIKATRVALLLEAIKTAQAKNNQEAVSAVSYVLRLLGTKESLLMLPGKEDSWDTLQEAVENSAIYALCQGAHEQVQTAKARLRLTKKCERHFKGIIRDLLQQRVDPKLLLLKPKVESTKQITQACRLLVHLPAVDALVVDHVAWDAKTLSRLMKDTADAPCSVLVTSTIRPKKEIPGWLSASTR